MWLAEGIRFPDYGGIIFRRTYPQLVKSNEGLIAKSHRIYPAMGGTWNGSEKKWKFPSGAIIEMGHLQYEKSVADYTGPSYHRVAFDELTQFTETQYTFLFGRIRHPENYPLLVGMRAGSNPGSEGHLWVKRRFVTPDALTAIRELGPRDSTPPGMIFWTDEHRAYVPARVADNPYIDLEDYIRKLSHLPPVTRTRMMNGDWSVNESGVIKAEWLKYFDWHGDYYKLGERGATIEKSRCERWTIADSAGTSEDVARENRGKAPSWYVITTVDVYRPDRMIFVRDIRRARWTFPQFVGNLREVFREQSPAWLGIEDVNNGRAALELLTDIPTKALHHEGKDKLARAGRLLNDFEAGRVFLPSTAPWRDDLEEELLSWTGDKDGQADQIDTLAYAALQLHPGWGDAEPWGGFIRGSLIGGRF